jgi:ankyrin repeat protein
LHNIPKNRDSILNNDIHALKEILKEKADINSLEKCGRTALPLAASYNRPYIQNLLSFPGVDLTIPDAVLRWTPLRYADRTKSWMDIDILLQNGAKPNDKVIYYAIPLQAWTGPRVPEG